MIEGYDVWWSCYKRKLSSRNEDMLGKVYKEISINDNRYLILRFQSLNNQMHYICKIWTGMRWYNLSREKTPRRAINKIKDIENNSSLSNLDFKKGVK